MEGKYVVFKTEEFFELMGELALPPWTDGKGEPVGGELDCAVLSAEIQKRVDEVCIKDATVIRRQDAFAPPALDAYANSITVALSLMPETGVPGKKESLSEIADYFHEQARISWDTDRKIPD